MNTIDFIWNGYSIKDERHLGELRSIFVRSLQKSCKGMMSEINRKAERCSNEFQRVKDFKSHFKWKPIPNDYFSCLSKNTQLSRLLKERANIMYEEKQFLAALRGYNLALMFAPTDSELVGLAFGNRAALFMKINKYDLALRDIKLALENNYPSESMEKLVARENTCRARLKNSSVAHSDFDSSINMTGTDSDVLEAFSQKNYKNLKLPNSTILNAESFVKIDFTEKCGRRLVVTKPVEAGTLICGEQPYSHMLVNILTWDTEHCHYCCRPILGGLPCPKCSFSLYCSEECRERSLKSYHQYEHKLYTYFHHNPGTCLLRDILALRIIFTVGPHELFRIFKTHDTDYFVDDTMKKSNVLGFNSKGIYDSSSYLTVYHLISHLTHLRAAHIISNCFKAFIYSHILEDHTEFFSSIDSLYSEKFTKENFKDFITSIIIHHMENIPFNAISVSKLISLDDSKLESNENDENSKFGNNLSTISYAMATYSLLSLCNHSCDPNVIPLRKPSKMNLSLVTLKNIKAGEELFISYGPIFHNESTDERMEFLQTKYNFICECTACKHKWGPEIFNYKSEPTEDSENVELKNQLLRADDFITKGNFIEAIEIIRPCLMHFTKNYPSKHPLTKMSQDLFKRALVWLFNSYGVYA